MARDYSNLFEGLLSDIGRFSSKALVSRIIQTIGKKNLTLTKDKHENYIITKNNVVILVSAISDSLIRVETDYASHDFPVAKFDNAIQFIQSSFPKK